MKNYLIFIALLVTDASEGKNLETDLEFDSESKPLEPRFNPKFWYEKNERNTSIHYDLWSKSDVTLLEWPGNITKLDPRFPLLKWAKSRAKYVHNICNQDYISMEMVAYAFKYVHLTWGPYRITRTYCPPLAIPANVINTLDSTLLESNATSLPVVDFGFVLDTFLIVTLQGSIIRVSGLEMAFAFPSQKPGAPLSYSLSKGLTSPITRVITQSCCSLAPWCPNGDTVLAYKESSQKKILFISYDGGKIFETIKMSLPSASQLLHSAILYPEQNIIAVLHGGKTWGIVNKFSMKSGKILSLNSTRVATNLTIKGNVQISRLGNEDSMLVWDDCSVWYSYNGESSFVKSLFYINKIIYPNWTANSLHSITQEHCHFGHLSSLSVSPTGKIGLLDENNILFFGLDSKKPSLQLVALKTDMTLLLPSKTLSIVPHFDVNDAPKLLYPPRYLYVDELDNITKNYSKREAMRLLIKSLFPSEFITVFYNEQVESPEIQKYTLKQCMTSTLSVNNSVTQKTQVILMSPSETTLFDLTFTSKSSALDQLSFEPKSVLKLLDVNVTLNTSSQLGPDQEIYWFKYVVKIRFKSVFGSRKAFLLNFYTNKDLRCNHPPQQSVWIVKHLGEKPEGPIPMEDILPPIMTNSDQPKRYWKSAKKSCRKGQHTGHHDGVFGTSDTVQETMQMMGKMK